MLPANSGSTCMRSWMGSGGVLLLANQKQKDQSVAAMKLIFGFTKIIKLE